MPKKKKLLIKTGFILDHHARTAEVLHDGFLLFKGSGEKPSLINDEGRDYLSSSIFGKIKMYKVEDKD